MAVGGSLDRGEPNLVPLLDIVFQLVMFFIISANFVMEQVNESIRLPRATSAKVLDAKASNLLFLNVNEKGHVLRTDGGPALTTPPQMDTYLRLKYQDEQRFVGEGNPVETVVIIRGDRQVTFEKIHMVMNSAKKAGFSTIQLRAIIESP